LVNNLDRLAENSSMVKARVKSKVYSFDLDALERAVRYYGKVGTKKFFADVLPESQLSYG